MTDAFRRRISLRVSAGEARGALVDDFHHVRVGLASADGVVSAVRADAIRIPWTTCPLAANELQRLAGLPVGVVAAGFDEANDRFLHCTHMLDLAVLAARALRDQSARTDFDMIVDRPCYAHTHARLECSDGFKLGWAVNEDQIEAPLAYAGVSLRAGFRGWARAHLDSEQYEAALTLRRALMVSRGRRYDLDAIERPMRDDGRCFSFQPQIAAHARRVIAATQTSAEFGRKDEDWLTFKT